MRTCDVMNFNHMGDGCTRGSYANQQSCLYDVAMTEPQRTPVRPDKQVQIADDLRIRIESGELAPGDTLPPVSDLIATYKCSTAAARAAVELLKQQGLVSGGRGKPPRVRVQAVMVTRWSSRHQHEKNMVLRPAEERARAGVMELDLNTPIEDVKFSASYSKVDATGKLAEAFNTPTETSLLKRTFEWSSKETGLRLLWSVSYLPYDLVKSRVDLRDETKAQESGSTQYQLYTLGIELSKIDDLVTARMPTTVDMELWGLEKGTPLLVVRRISVDTNGKVVEVSDAEFPADRTELGFTTNLDHWSPNAFDKEN
jgi:GntR family transcriptional regulator